MVARVGDVEVALQIERHARGTIQVSLRRRAAVAGVPGVAQVPPPGNGGDGAERVDLADAVVAVGGDVDVAGAISGKTHGSVDRPGRGRAVVGRHRHGVAAGRAGKHGLSAGRGVHGPNHSGVEVRDVEGARRADQPRFVLAHRRGQPLACRPGVVRHDPRVDRGGDLEGREMRRSGARGDRGPVLRHRCGQGLGAQRRRIDGVQLCLFGMDA